MAPTSPTRLSSAALSTLTVVALISTQGPTVAFSPTNNVSTMRGPVQPRSFRLVAGPLGACLSPPACGGVHEDGSDGTRVESEIANSSKYIRTRSRSVSCSRSSRRAFLSLSRATIVGTAASATASWYVAAGWRPRPALAVMDASSAEARAFKPGEKIGVEEARRRFSLARRDLRYLLERYEDISKGGGDAVRRYLGTVGVTSYMYGIGKVLNELRYEADDIVEFTEAMNEFNAYVYQADGAAYSSMFVEHSSAKGTPESYLKTAKRDAEFALRYMDQLAEQLGA